MPEVPKNEPGLPTDFRTINGVAPALSPKTLGGIYDAIERHSLIEDLLADNPEIAALAELPLASTDDDPTLLAQRERERLDVSIAEQIGWPNVDDALSYWRTRVEEQGILVFSSRVPRQDCHGFSFGSESLAPVIFLNDEELPQAQIFTLFHEYAHLMLRDTALCLEREGTDRGVTERFCNRFVAALLMPPDAVARAIVRAQATPDQDGWDLESIGQVARRLKVSRPALIIRLRDLGHDVGDLYEQAVAEWDTGTWREPTGGTGFALYHYRLTKSLGTRYVSTVLNAHTRGVLSVAQVCELLGSRRTHFEDLASHTARRMERFGRRA